MFGVQFTGKSLLQVYYQLLNLINQNHFIPTKSFTKLNLGFAAQMLQVPIEVRSEAAKYGR